MDWYSTFDRFDRTRPGRAMRWTWYEVIRRPLRPLDRWLAQRHERRRRELDELRRLVDDLLRQERDTPFPDRC